MRTAPAPHTAERTGPLPRTRGRHRKPRPRKVLLAAGGLALAAGAVTLIRLTSAPDGGGPGTGVEAVPRPTTKPLAPTEAPPSTRATPPSPEATPSSPEALGGPHTSPLETPERPSPPRTPSAKTPPPPKTPPPATTRPDTPRTPTEPPPDHRKPPPPHPARPTPTPEPEPEPEPSRPPGLCVPIIGLCVGGTG